MICTLNNKLTKRLASSLAIISATVAIGMAGQQSIASAANVTFEWDEGGPGQGVNSPFVSLHRSGGPVLADDFIPASSGWVSKVEWWGSAPFTSQDEFEITFHTDNNGKPAATGNFGGISQWTTSVQALDNDGDDVYHYFIDWEPQDVFLEAGSTYWFSVANASGNAWTWANPGGVAPTVGAQQFNAVESTGVGPNGGPHFGPWDSLDNQDFAFRISSVPEPLTLLGSATALGFGALFKREHSKRQKKG